MVRYLAVINKVKEILRDKRSLHYGVFFFALVSLGVSIPSHFTVTLTPSLKHRVFYIDKGAVAIKKGDYIMFHIVSKYHGGKPTVTVKQIGCDEGELLRSAGREFWCNNNEYLGKAKEYSRRGEKLDQFTYNGIIPSGFVFAVGHSRDSFDSRYYGLIKKTDVIAKVYPIL